MNKKIIGLSISLLGLILIYIGTYAYYMGVVNGTLNIKASSFAFNVLNNNQTFTNINLYNTMETPSVPGSGGIVPGDSGSFDLKISGAGSEVDIEYSIIFNGTNVPSNMKFYLDENKTKVLDVQTNKIMGYLDISESTTKTHTIYWEWPYDNGRYNNLDYNDSNKSISINISVEGKQSNGISIYGVKRNVNSTSTVWERIEDSIGLTANAVLSSENMNVVNNFDNIYPWSDIKSYNYNIETKKITAWYGDSNFKFDGTNGEVLTYIPGFYYKREVINNIEYQYISAYYIEGYSYSEPFSVGRYTMSGDSSRVYSRSGYTPLVSKTITQFRTYAENLGEGFSQMDYHYFVIQMLYLIEYADYDSQSKLGNGVVSSGSRITSGGTDTLGMKSGTLNNSKSSMIYRGIEDIYGNLHQFVDGINIKDNKAYINYDYKTYVSDTFTGNYQALGYINATTSGYATKVGYDSNNPLIDMPVEVTSGTTETEYNASIRDYYSGSSENKVSMVGGAYDYNNYAGLWFATTNFNSSSMSVTVGSRLIRHQ